MTREEIHQRFVDEFCKDQHSPVLDPKEFLNAELALNTLLPESYISFIRTHGPVSTPAILGLAVDKEAPFFDIMQIWPVSECVSATQLYWSGGMSKELVGFATDSGGNLFCFRRQGGGSRPDDAPVWLFDHDFCKDSKVTDSFDSWLLSYLKLRNLD